MSAVNTEVMQTASDLHHEVGNPSHCQAEHVFDDATALNAGDGVLNHDSDAGQDLVTYLITDAQFLALGLFLPVG